MLLARFYRSKQNKLLGFHLSGHAEYDEEGLDIVCASVSSAVMLTSNTITDIYKLNAKVEVLEDDILLKLRDDPDGDGDKLLLGLLMHLYLIEGEYGQSIKVEVIER